MNAVKAQIYVMRMLSAPTWRAVIGVIVMQATLVTASPVSVSLQLKIIIIDAVLINHLLKMHPNH